MSRSGRRWTVPPRNGSRTFRPQVESMEGRALMAAGLARFSFPILPQFEATGLTKGPDGSMWFDEQAIIARSAPGMSAFATAAFGKITPDGAVTLFPVPDPEAVGYVQGLTPLADGTLWFQSLSSNPIAGSTENSSHIGTLSTTGAVTLYDVPKGVYGFALTPGADGNLWFFEGDETQVFTPGETVVPFSVARITPAGQIEEVPGSSEIDGITMSSATLAQPTFTAAPDGSLWFAEAEDNMGVLVRVDTATGNLQAFVHVSRPGTTQSFGDIVISTDGTVWFDRLIQQESGAGRYELDRLTPDGKFAKVSLPSLHKNAHESGFAGGLAADTNGNVWFSELSASGNSIVAHTNVKGESAIIKLPKGTDGIPVAGANGTMCYQTGSRTLTRVSNAGKVSSAKVGLPHASANSAYNTIFSELTLGDDGSAWFVRLNGRNVYRYTFPTGIPHVSRHVNNRH